MKKAVLMAVLIPAGLSFGESRVGIGGLLNYGRDNLSTLGTGYLQSLNPERDTFTNLMPIGELYLERKTQMYTYYGGIFPKRDFFGITLGIKEIKSRTDINDIFLVFNPFRSVWEDPLLTGTDRKATNQREFGAGFMIDRKFFSINTIAVYSDVEKDKLGDRLPQLQRDGYRIENRLYLNSRISQGLFFKPGITLENFLSKGDASSYDSLGISLNLVYRKNDYILISFLNSEIQRYKEKDPVFNKKREDINTTIFTLLTKREVISKQTYISTIIGYNLKSSNLEFYDGERLFLAIITGYSF